MQQIYLDNASTSWPKAPGVSEAVLECLSAPGANIGRSTHADAYAAAGIVLDLRERLSALLGCASPRNIIFTLNATQALNLLLRGLLRSGDHVLVSSLEHNAVMRPLSLLSKETGIAASRIPLCGADGMTCPDAIPALLRPNTRAIIMLHASNVTGVVQPVEAIARIARQHGLYMILDVAQTAGVFPIDMTAWGIDAVAFAGHKGLLGPQGTGGFAIGDRLSGLLSPVLAGGTGSQSELEDMPAWLPDRFEPGTMNLPGLCGLSAALAFLEKTGIDTIRQRETALARMLAEGLSACADVRILGGAAWENRAGIVSVDFTGHDNADIADRLYQAHGIVTRCGLHCAPAAHRAHASFPQGAVRFSVGHATTEAEIRSAIDAVQLVLEEGRPRG